jgi:hypothetical protein
VVNYVVLEIDPNTPDLAFHVTKLVLVLKVFAVHMACCDANDLLASVYRAQRPVMENSAAYR